MVTGEWEIEGWAMSEIVGVVGAALGVVVVYRRLVAGVAGAIAGEAVMVFSTVPPSWLAVTWTCTKTMYPISL